MSNFDLTEFIRTVPDYPIDGVNFYDVNSLFAGPLFTQLINEMINSLRDLPPVVTHIAGIESRGFVLGSAIAYAMELPFVMIRKKGAKYPGSLLTETYKLEYGEDSIVLQQGILGHTDRVILVDDLIATGGTIQAASRLVEQTGARVLGCATIIDLKYLRNSEYPMQVVSLIEKQES